MVLLGKGAAAASASESVRIPYLPSLLNNSHEPAEDVNDALLKYQSYSRQRTKQLDTLYAFLCHHIRQLQTFNKQPMGCEAQLAAQLYKHFYDDL